MFLEKGKYAKVVRATRMEGDEFAQTSLTLLAIVALLRIVLIIGLSGRESMMSN
jgi:hypothetical protein